MKKLFRLTSVVLALLIITLTAVSCKNGKSTANTTTSESTASVTTGINSERILEIYNEAYEKTDSLEKGDCSVDANIDLKTTGITMNIPMSYNMKYHKSDNEITRMAMDMTLTVVGQETAMNMYYSDGYAYIDSDGYRFKQAIDYAGLLEEFGINDKEILVLNEEVLTDALLKNEEGKTIIDVTFDGNLLKDQLMSVIGGYYDMFGMTEDYLKDVKISDVIASFIIDENGYLSDTSCKFDITTEISPDDSDTAESGEETAAATEMSISIDMKVTYNNPGEDVTIEEPSDLAEYEEYTEDTTEYTEEYFEIYSALCELYDDNGQLVDNYEELLSGLYNIYGQVTVDTIFAEVQSLFSFED